MNLTVQYDIATGRILQASSPAYARPAWLDASIGVIDYEGEAKEILNTHYVVNDAIAARPTMTLTHPASVPIDTTWRLDGIPTGAQVRHPEGTLQVDDGFIEWSSAEPGEYEFRLSLFPYLDEVVYAVVTEA